MKWTHAGAYARIPADGPAPKDPTAGGKLKSTRALFAGPTP